MQATYLTAHLMKAIISRTDRIFRGYRGFTLIEIAIVLVIIGLILGAGATFWRSSISSTRFSTTKTNLENIKNAVINFSIANGRLPCPDSTVPPNNTGQSNPVGAGICAGCGAPPCYVPFQTLQIQLPSGMDSFGNVFRYDVSYDTAGAGAAGGLTNTTSETFCAVLYEYLVHAADPAVPRVPCVTNQNDAADNGQIGAAGQGYAVAAVVISQTDGNSNIFNAPVGLNLKNIAGTPREYEMAGRLNGGIYGNLVGELTFGELYNKVCTSQKTKIRIQNNTTLTKYIQFAGTSNCMPVNIGGFIELYQGNSLNFYNDVACTTLCGVGNPVTFNMAGANDAGTIDWGGAGNNGRDGRVLIATANCVLGDN
jgi:prepilin-type N-terminal cleavage/methylation domain-containing protein